MQDPSKKQRIMNTEREIAFNAIKTTLWEIYKNIKLDIMNKMAKEKILILQSKIILCFRKGKKHIHQL